MSWGLELDLKMCASLRTRTSACLHTSVYMCPHMPVSRCDCVSVRVCTHVPVCVCVCERACVYVCLASCCSTARHLTRPHTIRGIPAIPGTRPGQPWENGSFWKGWECFLLW